MDEIAKDISYDGKDKETVQKNIQKSISKYCLF